MTEEQYEKLNFYLGKLIPILEQNGHSFLTLNTETITMLSKKCWDVLLGLNANVETESEPLSFDEIINLSRQILSNIDVEWLNEFNRLIKDNLITFDANYSFLDFNDGACKLYLELKYNCDDVRTIIHEFAHYMSYKDLKVLYESHNIFSEFYGIYFELYATQYIKSIGKKIDCLYRIKDFQQCYIRNLRQYDIQFLMFKKYGRVDLNTFLLVDNMFYYFDGPNCIESNKYMFECRCRDLLSYLESFDDLEAVAKNTKLNCGTSITKDYIYMWGGYLAYYAYKHCNVKDIARLCCSTANVIDDKQLYDMFCKFGIDFCDTLLFDDALLVMQEFIEEYGKENKVMI